MPDEEGYVKPPLGRSATGNGQPGHGPALYGGAAGSGGEPAGPPPAVTETAVPLAEKLRVSAVGLLPAAVLIAAVLGSIFAGVASPTEAAAVGAFLSILIAALYGRLTLGMLREVSQSTTRISASTTSTSRERSNRTASAAPGAERPVVVIPAGQLKAGAPCGQTPRVSNEELVGDPIDLAEFSIDVFPYPNDPTKPARVEVTLHRARLQTQRGTRVWSAQRVDMP